MDNLKLFMLLLGCKPKGRHTEQHDVFFSVGQSIKDLVPEIIQFWPEAQGKIHIDAWREVTYLDNFRIHIEPRSHNTAVNMNNHKIFFLNLGGYKENEFEEYHYKMLCIGVDKTIAVQQAKKTIFYKHTGFKTAESHIDDKYGVDVDDVYQIEEILPSGIKEKYHIALSPSPHEQTDDLHLGYFQLHKL